MWLAWFLLLSVEGHAPQPIPVEVSRLTRGGPKVKNLSQLSLKGLLVQAAAIIACNYFLLNWYLYAFALGEYEIGQPGSIGLEHQLRLHALLAVVAAGLAIIGFAARRWPWGQAGLAICGFFILLIVDSGIGFLPFFCLSYCIAVAIACAAHAGKRWLLGKQAGATRH